MLFLKKTNVNLAQNISCANGALPLQSKRIILLLFNLEIAII